MIYLIELTEEQRETAIRALDGSRDMHDGQHDSRPWRKSVEDTLNTLAKASIDQRHAKAFEAARRTVRLKTALEESVKLQSHYAALLNSHDNGERLHFENADQWLERLDALKSESLSKTTSPPSEQPPVSIQASIDRSPRVVHSEEILLNREKVLAITNSTFTPEYAGLLPPETRGKIDVEVKIIDEWIPVADLLKLGEFEKKYLLRMVATPFPAE